MQQSYGASPYHHPEKRSKACKSVDMLQRNPLPSLVLYVVVGFWVVIVWDRSIILLIKERHLSVATPLGSNLSLPFRVIDLAMASLPPKVDPSKTSFAANPNGDPPNFLDPPSLAPDIFTVGLSLIIISGLIVILRLVTNAKIVGKWGLDDCMSIPVYLRYLGLKKYLGLTIGKHCFQIYVSLPKWRWFVIGRWSTAVSWWLFVSLQVIKSVTGTL